MARARIAVAGCQHETNTFAPMLATYEEFVKADAWPGLTCGEDLFDSMAGKNLPLAGFIDAARRRASRLLPILWRSAEPSSFVTQDAFERIADMVCSGLADSTGIDAVYLDLHGAMVTEKYADGEGELLGRVRDVIGGDTPLVASLDLHANITSRMVELVDGFTLFRTYPHIDMALAAGKPVVLADVQDNPGAGGSSDTVGLLQALLRNHAQGAVMAVMHDPEAAAIAGAAGVGSSVEIGLGGKSGQPGQAPYQGKFRVEATTSGKFLCTGEMYGGLEADIGPMALLRAEERDCDVRVVVGSERMQCLDLAIFRHMGVQPEQQRILAIKSTVHFRADFDPIAGASLLVEAPGAHPCRLIDLDYKNLRRGVRLEPMGPAH